MCCTGETSKTQLKVWSGGGGIVSKSCSGFPLAGYLEPFSLAGPCYSTDFSPSQFPSYILQNTYESSVLNLPMVYKHIHLWSRIVVLPYSLAYYLAGGECYLQGSHQEPPLPGNLFCDYSPYWYCSFLSTPVNHWTYAFIFPYMFYVCAKISSEVFEISVY